MTAIGSANPKTRTKCFYHIVYKIRPILIKFCSYCPEYICHRVLTVFPPHLNNSSALPCKTFNFLLVNGTLDFEIECISVKCQCGPLRSLFSFIWTPMGDCHPRPSGLQALQMTIPGIGTDTSGDFLKPKQCTC